MDARTLSEKIGPLGITIVIRPVAKGAIMHDVDGKESLAMVVKRATLMAQVVTRGRHLL